MKVTFTWRRCFRPRSTPMAPRMTLRFNSSKTDITHDGTWHSATVMLKLCGPLTCSISVILLWLSDGTPTTNHITRTGRHHNHHRKRGSPWKGQKQPGSRPQIVVSPSSSFL